MKRLIAAVVLVLLGLWGSWTSADELRPPAGGCFRTCPVQGPLSSVTLVPPVPLVACTDGVTERPSPEHVWVPGWWVWRGPDCGYVWSSGRWVVPPERGYVWEPPWWRPKNGRYYWRDGAWTPPWPDNSVILE